MSSRSSFTCNYDERMLLDVDGSEDGKSGDEEEDLFVDAISKE